MKVEAARSMIRVIGSRRILVTFIMGFGCGLPLLLTITVLQAWMKEEGIELGTIGLMSLVGLPYTLKFLWAPILDRYTFPVLGRRRGWLAAAQVLLAVSIAGIGFTDPARSPWTVAFLAFLTTFFSASQDIVVDAYRREDLADEELGLGASFYVNGYRLGMLFASGGGLILADRMPFRTVYLIMAVCMVPCLATTLFTPEPPIPQGTPRSLREAVVEPLTEYFDRPDALWILSFILLYKLGDTMASTMTTPFYLEAGFTKTQIGAVVKLFGFWTTVGGGFIGGIAMLRIGIHRSLWIFGVLQAISTACFALLLYTGPAITALAGVIAFENLSAGMGTAVFVAFMASITHKRFTATQYALLSSLMGVPRVVASAPTGFLVSALGWGVFFTGCAIIALPGILLLLKFAPWRTIDGPVS